MSEPMDWGKHYTGVKMANNDIDYYFTDIIAIGDNGELLLYGHRPGKEDDQELLAGFAKGSWVDVWQANCFDGLAINMDERPNKK